MTKTMREFYRSLPDKCCAACGKVIMELADSYKNECDQCTTDKFYAIHSK